MQTEIALIQKDIENFSAIFGRLDVAIEKIGIVSTDLTKMLAVHEERFVSQERDHIHLKTNNSLVHTGFAAELKELNEKIQENTILQNKEIADQLHAIEKRITYRISGMEKLLEEDRHRFEARISLLERWRFVLIGSFMAVGGIFTFLFDKIFYLYNTKHIP